MLKITFYTLLLAGLLSLASSFSQTAPPASISGRIINKASAPVPSASVALYIKDSLLATCITNAKGAYAFNKLKPGVYKIKITSGAYPEKIIGMAYNGHPKKQNVMLKTVLDELEEARDDKNKGATVKREEKSFSAKTVGSTAAMEAAPMGSYRHAWTSPNPYPDAGYNTESYNKIDDNEFKESKKNPLSTLSIDVDRASYSNVRRFILQGRRPPEDAVRVEEMINYFTYNYPQPKNNQPFSISTQYMDCPWNSKHQLIHIGIQGREIKTENMPANNLVFLIDVSGSMADANKLPLLQSGLRLLVDQMRPQDKIAIVVYAGAAGVVLPSTAGSNKETILAALDNLSAGGSTAGGEGILLAYKTAQENFLKEGNNRVILATDGDFNVGTSSDGELVRLIEKQRESGVFLTVLGFGTGNYKDSKMEQLADKGNGNYAYIDNLLEAKKTLVKEMGGTLLTIAKDVKIQVEFNPAKVKAYRLVGYENRLLNSEDFNDDKKDAGELGSGHTVTAMYEIIPAGSDELVASVDSLKYQKALPLVKQGGDEIMTIKFRYKEPKESASKLITEVLSDNKRSSMTGTEDARFACAVAEFGMLLRDSKYKGDADYKSVIAMAKASKGKDEEGYRAEFIRLVEMAELLKSNQTTPQQAAGYR